MSLDFKTLNLVNDHLYDEYSKEFFTVPFLKESNKIEGEVTAYGQGRLYPSDKKAIEWLNSNKLISVDDICNLHQIVWKRIKKDWVWKLRTYDVHIRKRNKITKTVDYRLLPLYMEAYMESLPFMNSWEAHTLFELIHPFTDLNGRVGRLIWLYKKKMIPPRIGFLNAYYYETLENMREKRSKKINKLLLELIK